MRNDKAQSAEKKTIIHAFSLIAIIFFAVYAAYYLLTGEYFLGYVYIIICAGVIASLIIFQLIKNETLALSVLASLGLPVLIPWQISGGVGVAGVFWYYIYIVWLFFLLGRAKGLIWIIGVGLISISEFVFQRLGYLASPYSLETMLSFYFGYILETAVLYVSQSTKEKTSRQLADERNKLLQAKAKDEAILGSIGEGVVAIDRAGNIVLFNYAAQIMSGISQNNAIGRHYKKVLRFYNEKDKLDISFVTLALSGKWSDITHIGSIKQIDNSAIATAHSAAPVVDTQGKVDGAVIVFRDITRERQIEHMKDEFLAVASHELRTPMGAVRANLAMILDGDYGPVNKDLIEPLKDMKSSTIRLVELVNDLLSVVRIEAGRILFTLGDFDILSATRDVVTSLVPLGKEKSIQVSLTPDSAHADVQADVAKVKQVLTNLIGNSLKFTDKGWVKVSIDNRKDMVEVSVSDTGLGIAPDDQGMLFTKFNQITPIQSTKPAGTGLGLYISREIVRKMGGDLWLAKSVVDKGSTFTFTLPRTNSPKAQKARRAIKQESRQHPDQK